MEVARADVVVAAYDDLFTGFAIEAKSIGLLLIDDGCRARAKDETGGLHVETLGRDDANAFQGAGRTAFGRQAADLADRHDLRRQARSALATLEPGPARRSAFLDAEGCRLATRIEERRLRDPGLHPGMSKAARRPAIEIAMINLRIRKHARFRRALADLLERGEEISGRLRIGAPDPATGLHAIIVSRVKPVHPNCRPIPVLHLDATLRPASARKVLPNLSMTQIEADEPAPAPGRRELRHRQHRPEGQPRIRRPRTPGTPPRRMRRRRPPAGAPGCAGPGAGDHPQGRRGRLRRHPRRLHRELQRDRGAGSSQGRATANRGRPSPAPDAVAAGRRRRVLRDPA